MIGTFAAALVAVLASFIVPIEITLNSANTEIAPPDGVGQILSNLLLKLVDSPVNAPCLLLTILEFYLGQSFLESL